MAEEVKNEIVEATQEVEITPAPKSSIDYLDGATLNKAYKNASVIAQSGMIPQRFQNKPADVLIAMDMASRMGIGITAVMQNLYVVQGTPAWSGQFCVAAINNCGKFSPLTYVNISEGGGGVIAKATRYSDGEVCESTPITMELAKNEGWTAKNGSKWKTMPEQMMRYRAAAFFARTYCPEVLMGMQTADEVVDVKGEEAPKQIEIITLN